MDRVQSASRPNRSALPFTPVELNHRRILLFVAPPGSVSDAMAAAIEREFVWISVRYVPELDLACTSFDCNVQLIIVDSGLLEASPQNCRRLADSHPGAMIAAMTAAELDCPEELMQIIFSRLVRGILPMDVNLDISLAIIRIMLKGGEYFPHTLFHEVQQAESTNHGVLAAERPQLYSGGEQWSNRMERLTDRELEILKLVSRGDQNKIIAANLGLSEHTVKIHIHNIITKLGVHNRTEASAKFFAFSSQHQGGRH